ncbi:MAG: DUF58 domain-containing protein [Lachnospiraceae bacterium]|nr:DUF58 domain-containing protein [Lachnospiraceae bacterium]
MTAKKEWIIYISLLILSLTVISFYGGAVSYGFFFITILIPIISLIYVLCVFATFKVYQEIGSRNIVADNSTPYYFILQNESFFSYAGIRVVFHSELSTVEDIPDTGYFELIPGDKYRYETSLRCKYRGEYEVGIKEIMITDFLGLLRLTFPVKEAKRVIVSPKYICPSEIKSVPDIDSLIMNSRSDETSEPDILTREYIAGDPLKQINWKASARAMKLMTKKMAAPEKRGISVILDTGRYDTDPCNYLRFENKALEILLSLVFYLAEKNTENRICCSDNGPVIRDIYDIREFDEFYSEVSLIRFDKDNSIEHHIEDDFLKGAVYGRRIIFLILLKGSAEIIEKAGRLSDENTLLIIYLVTDEDISDLYDMETPCLRIIRADPSEDTEVIL